MFYLPESWYFYLQLLYLTHGVLWSGGVLQVWYYHLEKDNSLEQFCRLQNIYHSLTLSSNVYHMLCPCYCEKQTKNLTWNKTNFQQKKITFFEKHAHTNKSFWLSCLVWGVYREWKKEIVKEGCFGTFFVCKRYRNSASYLKNKSHCEQCVNSSSHFQQWLWNKVLVLWMNQWQLLMHCHEKYMPERNAGKKH